MLFPVTLLLAAPAICFTDTVKADFDQGVLTTVSATVDGNVELPATQVADQGDAPLQGFGFVVSQTWYLGQTFKAAVSGPLTKITTSLACAGCTLTGPNPAQAIKVGIRATTGSPALPTGGDLATSTIAAFADNVSRTKTAIFATPMNVVAGVTYMLYFGTSVAQQGQYEITRDTNNAYSRGSCVVSPDGGATWSAPCNPNHGLAFQTYVGYPFASGGNFVSQVRQVDPLVSWSSMTWGRTVPTSTSVTLQLAGSTSPSGPFTYVGPDGTSGSSFALSASLAQFAGKPYLRYRAVLASTDPNITPALTDVTLCYQTLDTTTSAANVSATYPMAVPLEATLTGPSGAVVGRSVSFSINGVFAASGTTDGSGVAQVDVSNPGAGALAFVATFAGDGVYAASNAAGALNVAKAAQVVLFEPPSAANLSAGSVLLSATGGLSGNPVVLSASSSKCHVAGDTLYLDAPGTCTVHANQAGNADFTDAAEVVADIALEETSQTISFEPLADFIWRGGSATLAAASTSGLPVAFTVVSGPCRISATTVTSEHAGRCVIAAAQPGDQDDAPATTQTQAVAVGKATPEAIVFAPLPNVPRDVGPFQLSATGSGASTPVTFSTSSAACSLLGDVVIVANAGPCTIDANQAADDDYEAATQVTQSFDVLSDAVAGMAAEAAEPAQKPTTGCRCNNASPDFSAFALFAFVIALRTRSLTRLTVGARR